MLYRGTAYFAKVKNEEGVEAIAQHFLPWANLVKDYPLTEAINRLRSQIGDPGWYKCCNSWDEMRGLKVHKIELAPVDESSTTKIEYRVLSEETLNDFNPDSQRNIVAFYSKGETIIYNNGIKTRVPAVYRWFNNLALFMQDKTVNYKLNQIRHELFGGIKQYVNKNDCQSFFDRDYVKVVVENGNVRIEKKAKTMGLHRSPTSQTSERLTEPIGSIIGVEVDLVKIQAAVNSNPSNSKKLKKVKNT